MIEKGLESAQKFLEAICLPASEELGLILKDQVRIWRLKNIIRIVNKSQNLLDFKDDSLVLRSHPRIVSGIINKGSWQDSIEIQDMWAGLLASSCDNDGESDENIIFINILDEMTLSQARIINYYATTSEKIVDQCGLVKTEKGIILDSEDFFEIIKENNIEKIASEIKHLIALGLVEEGLGLASGFFEEEVQEHGTRVKTGKYKVGLKISALALRLYVKGQGSKMSVKDYFNL